MYQLADTYPADAIGGSDFLTLAAQRKIVDTDVEGEPILRSERVIVTDRFYTGDEFVTGRACFSEQTVRALGAELGLVAPPVVRSLQREIATLTHQLDQAEGKNVDLLRAWKAFEDTELVRVIYVGPDGSEHPSRPALAAHLAGVKSETPPTVEPFQEAANG